MWNIKTIFIKDSLKVNMKDYIEVNSAIALALQGLEYGIKEVNFKNKHLKTVWVECFLVWKQKVKAKMVNQADQKY